MTGSNASKIICPICGRTSDIQESRFENFLVCLLCGGHFAKKTEAPAYLEDYFEEEGTSFIPPPKDHGYRPVDEWNSNLKGKEGHHGRKPMVGGFIYLAARPLARLFLWMRLRKIFRLPKTIRILDYGAGDGKLVAYLRSHGLDAVGFDPSPAAVKVARNHGRPVYSRIDGPLFDLMMFWHSLEHAEWPLEVIAGAREHLGTGGRLLIAVPNAASWEARFFGSLWFHYDYPFHVVQFTPVSLSYMLEKNGFKITSWDFFSPEYTLSGLVQSFLNLFFPKNFLYSLFSQRRFGISRAYARLYLVPALPLIVIFLPFLVLFFFLELVCRRSGAMIVMAERQ